MKKIFFKLLLLLFWVTIIFNLSGCTVTSVSNNGDSGDNNTGYSVWLNQGHTGTEEDFLNWIKTTIGGQRYDTLAREESERTTVNNLIEK